MPPMQRTSIQDVNPGFQVLRTIAMEGGDPGTRMRGTGKKGENLGTRVQGLGMRGKDPSMSRFRDLVRIEIN